MIVPWRVPAGDNRPGAEPVAERPNPELDPSVKMARGQGIRGGHRTVPHVIVAGAGIGGLCAAIAVRRQGFAVTVLERQPSPREVGAGLGLWVNAVRALKRIGVGDLVESIAVPDGGGGISIAGSRGRCA